MKKTDINNTRDLINADRNSYFHPFTAIQDQKDNGALVMDTASGCTITDISGNEYLDGAAGLWCVNVGYGREEISKAIYDQSCNLPYFHSFNTAGNKPSIELSQRLLAKAPANMKRVFYGSSGSDANDTAVKILWTYNILRGKPEKRKVISRHYAYHGVTVAAGSLTGIPAVHQDFGLPLDFARHVSKPDLYRDAPARGITSDEAYSAYLAQELEDLILAEGPETVAGFVAEPVMGTGGVHLPPKGYFEAVQEVLDRHDIRMVADEVITGFGRTGEWFATSKYNIKADLILTAKGLTSGYLPLSAILVGDRMWSVLENAASDGRAFAHGFTYSGHPTCIAAALANLDVLEQEDLITRVADLSPYFTSVFEQALSSLDIVGDIRSVGFMMGIEMVANRETKAPFPVSAKIAGRIALSARNNGILVRALPNSDVIALSPPFIISKSEIDTLATTLKKSILDITDQISSEGLLKKQG